MIENNYQKNVFGEKNEFKEGRKDMKLYEEKKYNIGYWVEYIQVFGCIQV